MAPTNNLNQVLATVSKDFASLKVSISKLLQTKKIEGRNQYFERNRERRNAYGLKYDRATLDKRASLKNSLSDQAKTIKSSMSTFGGLFGNLLLIMGVAGIGKMLLSSETGKYFSKFLKSIFESVVDIIKKTGSLLLEIFQDLEVKQSLLKTFKAIFKFVGQFFVTSIGVAASLLKDSEVLQSLGKIVMGIFSAIAEVLKASYEILVEIASTNIETIKTAIVELFTKIVDVIVPLLGIMATVLSKDGIFVTKIVEIASGILNLVLAALNQEYTNPTTGEKVNIWGEVAIMLGKGLLLAAAFVALKAKLFIWAAQISASKAIGGSSNCDCGLVTPEPDKKPGGKPSSKPEKPSGKPNPRGTTGPGNKASERLSKFKEVPKATRMERFKYVVEKHWKKLLDLGTKLRYGSKAVDVIVSFVTRKFTQFTGLRATIFVGQLLGSIVAAGVPTGIGNVIGWVSLGLNLWFFGELTLDIIDYLGENSDAIIKEIEEEEKGSKQVKIQNVEEIQYDATGAAIGAVPMASTSPTPATQTAAAVPAATPSQGPQAAPIPTPAPPPQAKSPNLLSGESIRDVIGQSEGGQSGYNATYGYGYGKQDPLIEKMFGVGKKLTDLTIDEVLMYTKARGGNKGAVGKYQFIPTTLKELVSKASGYAIHFQTKFTPQVQDTLYGIFSQSNVKVLKANGIPITPENIHLAHAVGPQGAVKLIKHSDQNANIQDVLGFKKEARETNPHLNVPIFKYRETLAAKYGGGVGVSQLANLKADQAFPLNSSIGKLPAQTEEQKKSLTDIMFDDLNAQLAALDKMTGGKLGLSSGEMQANLRELEDKMRAQPSLFDFSTTVVMNTTKKEVSKGTTSLKDTNENILSAIMNRHYA
jgi:hypothetical protein